MDHWRSLNLNASQHNHDFMILNKQYIHSTVCRRWHPLLYSMFSWQILEKTALSWTAAKCRVNSPQTRHNNYNEFTHWHVVRICSANAPDRSQKCSCCKTCKSSSGLRGCYCVWNIYDCVRGVVIRPQSLSLNTLKTEGFTVRFLGFICK